MTGSATLQTYRYRVDRTGILAEVSPNWDDFARDNGGGHLLERDVVGRPLKTFITDPTTRLVYQQLFVRMGALGAHSPVTFPFRCDAPGRRRFMEMALRPTGDGGVWLESREVKVESRPEVDLLSSHVPANRRNGEPLHVCSWCKRARFRDGWLELEAYVTASGVMERARLPLITHGMCPGCEAEMMSLVKSMPFPDEEEP